MHANCDYKPASGEEYSDMEGHHHSYLFPVVKKMLANIRSNERRLFECGCGNGSFGNRLAKEGWDITGIDPSISATRAAQKYFPHLKIESGSTDEDLAARFGTFPCVMSLEVVEHIYSPREYASKIFDLLEPGGSFILSTPYHGYLKNLAIALTGKWDHHHTALWDHGHIKFWSIATISKLLNESGFDVAEINRAGRVPPLAKSMVIRAVKKS